MELHLQYTRDSILLDFPREWYGFPQELTPGDPGNWADKALAHLFPLQKQPSSPPTCQSCPKLKLVDAQQPSPAQRSAILLGSAEVNGAGEQSGVTLQKGENVLLAFP